MRILAGLMTNFFQLKKRRWSGNRLKNRVGQWGFLFGILVLEIRKKMAGRWASYNY